MKLEIDLGKIENKYQLLGLIGSILLCVGVFMPILSLPFVGAVNYFNNGKGDGVIILILAAFSLFLSLYKKLKALWLTGLASLGVLLYTFIGILVTLSQAQADINRDLADNPFKGLADLALQSIHIQWGWVVLFGGAILLILAAQSALKVGDKMVEFIRDKWKEIKVEDKIVESVQDNWRKIIIVTISIVGIVSIATIGYLGVQRFSQDTGAKFGRKATGFTKTQLSQLQAATKSLTGTYPWQVFDTPPLGEMLLGVVTSRQEEFKQSLSVASPITDQGQYIVGSGCYPHLCGVRVAAFAFDKETCQMSAVMIWDNNLNYWGVNSIDDLPLPLKTWMREQTNGQLP
ncbi:MAG: hypothetical protein MUP30_00685 [Deltaproteobacteria bacterium]|nr:hypothetical protein [Deltaproteobacteria bacterium]